jgi:membrane-bound ClpP family serine protease
MSTLAWPLLLLAFGLLLLVSEVFIPSGGLIGLLAVSCLVLSLWKAFQYSTDLGVKFLVADLVLLPAAMAAAVYLWPRTPLAKRVFLRPPAPEEIEVSHSAQRLDHLIGQLGRALTPLRPSGMVDFDGRRLDALSEDGLIPSGALIQAVRVRSGQVIVRVAPDPTLDEILNS